LHQSSLLVEGRVTEWLCVTQIAKESNINAGTQTLQHAQKP